MKQLLLIVRPYLAETILQAVAEHDVLACTVDEVKGYGRQKGYLDRYLGSEYSLAFLPKVEISIWVADEHAEALAARLAQVGRTGRIGDGKLFVFDTAWPEALEF
jgi:nitrogen regulatory protein PII